MSTAKSMVANYKRQTLGAPKSQRFKSSTSNIATSSNGTNLTSNSRLKATSMTNLMADATVDSGRMQRPASRSALDSIHNGMNAKYASIQSKVLLQNIRPQVGPSQQQAAARAKSPQTRRVVPSSQSARLGAGQQAKANEKLMLSQKVSNLQVELEKLQTSSEELKAELDREKADKSEQVAKLKQELEEKIAEHEKQNEEYHQKLLEAYDLADQNRRTADSALLESRQRDAENKKKIEELESQLNELKEFVSMKEEMTGKMYELKEQLREERERYEEQLKSLHQVFESEKVSMLAAKQPTNNYFNRLRRNKQNLHSSESINENSNRCHMCQSNPNVNHQSDIYGSKLSTRMQDTAKSAWKASKHFASSVITGKGVGLSACRKNKQTASNNKQSNGQMTQVQAGGNQQIGYETIDQHTSVVAISSSLPSSTTDCEPATTSPVGTTSQSATGGADDSQLASSVVRVDENNKLTIVTKFNDNISSPNSDASSGVDSKPVSPNHSTGNESSEYTMDRSRCESSSSGRGTSDAGSSATSQNGDQTANATITMASGDDTGKVHGKTNDRDDDANNNGDNCQRDASTPPASSKQTKTHKRKSSLFKAGKAFSGSQVSLNKLKSFFKPSNSGKAAIGAYQQQHQQQQQQIGQQINQQQQQPYLYQRSQSTTLEVNNNIGYDNNSGANQEHLESSRLRCMELNQAIRQASKVKTGQNESPVDVDVVASNCTDEISSTNEPHWQREGGKPDFKDDTTDKRTALATAEFRDVHTASVAIASP